MGEEPALEDREIIRVLKALADPIRFKMVQKIAAGGEMSCGQVGQCFDVSQPTISHHLKILIEAGVVVTRTEGRHHITSVDQALLGRVADLLPTQLALPSSKKRKSGGR